MSYFLTLTLLTGSTEIGWQVTNYREIFEIGSLPLTHPKITTLLASRTTKGRRRGSSKATFSRNGKHPDRVPFCGSMGNVSCLLVLMLSQKLMVSILVAGSGKSVFWHVKIKSLHFCLENLRCLPVPQSSRRSKQYGNVGLHHSRSILL